MSNCNSPTCARNLGDVQMDLEATRAERDRYRTALEKLGRMENAPVIARMALHPISEAALAARLGPSVAEQLGAGCEHVWVKAVMHHEAGNGGPGEEELIILCKKCGAYRPRSTTERKDE